MPHLFVRGGKREMEIVGTATWSGAAATTSILPIPVDARPGDYLLAFHAPRLTAAATPTTPTGWTQHLLQTFGNSRLVVYGKEMVEGDTDASVTLNANASNMVAATVALRRAKNSAPVDASVSNTSAVTTSATSPTVTTTAAKALVFRAIWLVNNSTANPPNATWSGRSKLVEATNGLSANSVSLSVVADLQEIPGAAGTVAIAISPSSTSGVWTTLAIAPL
ncbi:hypothetical protein [Rhodococcus sp. ARP2]|uniref:hypothetical protein n=1 Tax=Rhodococcus sp. ARP2 TaxID=1661385 RepID=UPI0011876AA5|nr:hypothetical protein [Rhodococcus sp. ARP2]